jgi:hypothetical protein
LFRFFGRRFVVHFHVPIRPIARLQAFGHLVTIINQFFDVLHEIILSYQRFAVNPVRRVFGLRLQRNQIIQFCGFFAVVIA